MSITTPPALGSIIASETVRKIIYGIWVVALLTIGAVQAALATTQAPQPTWLSAALNVVGYLGIPVGGLALANTSNTKVAAPVVAAPVAEPVAASVVAAPVAAPVADVPVVVTDPANVG